MADEQAHAGWLARATSYVQSKLRELLGLFVGPGAEGAYDYNSHMERRALAYAVGVDVIILGGAASALLRLLPVAPGSSEQLVSRMLDQLIGWFTRGLVRGPFETSHVLAAVALLACVAVGVAILGISHRDHNDFMRSYGAVADPYSAEQKARARRFAFWCWVGSAACLAVAAVLLAVTLALRHHGAPTYAYLLVDAFFFRLLAFGAALWVYASLMAARLDVFAYNYYSLRCTTFYELNAHEQGEKRAHLLRQKAILSLHTRIVEVLWFVAVLVALVLYGAPGSALLWYWVPPLVAAVAGSLIQRAGLNEARRLADQRQLTGAGRAHGRPGGAASPGRRPF